MLYYAQDSECALLQEQLLRLRELHSADKVLDPSIMIIKADV